MAQRESVVKLSRACHEVKIVNGVKLWLIWRFGEIAELKGFAWKFIYTKAMLPYLLK